jgi:hypothetical protein
MLPESCDASLVTCDVQCDHEPLDSLQFGRVYWDVASVDEGSLGFESVGIVAATAGVLDHAGVPILYLSTWNTDYVLLLSSKREAAEAALNKCMQVQSV